MFGSSSHGSHVAAESGGEGTAERMCGVWGDATVACCPARSSAGCAGCAGACAVATCGLLVRWTRFAPPAASKPRERRRRRTKLDRVRGMERLSAPLRSCTLVSARPAGGTVHSRPCGCTANGDNLPRIRVAGSGLSACELCTEYDANHKTEHTCAPAHIPRSTKTSRNRTKPPRLVRPCSYMQ